MLDSVREFAIVLLTATGLFFFTVATVGLLRLPDVYTRLHAATKGDTLGAALILLAMALHGGLERDTLKLLLIIVFIWITTPTASHLVGKAAYRTGVLPHTGTFRIVDYRRQQGEDGGG